MTDTTEQPNCRDCRHYRITWDPKAPYGCRALGFKTRKLPSRVVFETSGIACQQFAKKTRVGAPTPDP